MAWIYITNLFGGSDEHWQHNQICKYMDGQGHVKLSVEHVEIGVRREVTHRIFEDETALDAWLEEISENIDVIPTAQISIAMVIQALINEEQQQTRQMES